MVGADGVRGGTGCQLNIRINDPERLARPDRARVCAVTGVRRPKRVPPGCERSPRETYRVRLTAAVQRHAARIRRRRTRACLVQEESDTEELAVKLRVNSMKDFNPASLVEQVPELKKLMELRDALVALKGPLGNAPAFRKAIEGVLADDESRGRVLGELGLNAAAQNA